MNSNERAEKDSLQFRESEKALGKKAAELVGNLSLNNQIIDATVRAIVQHTDGIRLQVDFGKNQTALIHEWQVARG